MVDAPKYLTGDPAGIQEFLDKFDVFLFDCDGVLWSGDITFEGTVETLEMLRQKGKQIIFVTNNSTKSRADYKKKLESLGIPADVKVFVLGETGIEQELNAENVPFIGGTDPTYRRDISPHDFGQIATGDPSIIDPEVGVVLAGLDFHINYLKLALAYHYLRRGAVFLATNTDVTLPNAGSFFPGAGTISAPLIRMLGGKEPVALGKPSQAMMDAIEGKFKLQRHRACMVGDRLDTDIRFGIEGGLGGTLAVLTGVNTKVDFTTGPLRPTAYVDGLKDLLEAA
ncbi:4-nitrophenylphosphatase [Histoplasma capsulatum H143]|uniref:4-nitrophenylphosphatase n=1 Tax=Ajellomyces capsulatus (strain H143) TaxID=544712 RepID=C6H4J9_AJECH|nr:4-nitrophenylphosphatase [Histoplasma capsulatum H143]